MAQRGALLDERDRHRKAAERGHVVSDCGAIGTSIGTIVRRRSAGGGVAQPLAPGFELLDRSVQLVRLGEQQRTIDPWCAVAANMRAISSSENPATRPSAISASRSATLSSKTRSRPRLPIDVIRPHAS